MVRRRRLRTGHKALDPPMPLTLHAALLGLGIASLLAAAAQDVLARTIPHAATAAIAVIGLALRLGDGRAVPALTAAALVLAGGWLLWRAGWLGGGDVKLFVAVALLLPPDRLAGAAIAISTSGALLALPYILARGRLARPPPGGRTLSLPLRAWRLERHRLRRGGPLPYGAAIAVGVLVAIWTPGG